MKDTQQHLLIEDLDYCNTVGNETEDIVGGGKFWKAVKKTFKEKGEAVMDFFHEAGTPTKAETILNLVEPTPIGILRNLFS
ncbi:hypothetical protein [Microcoleus sp. S13C4]|uniref:hypothetical protein n=1 Tax=Microcoleus sp. S13C4 TaxID=3055410 RepID=UPI002FD1A7FB